VSLLGGLLLTSERRLLRQRLLWIAAALIAFIALLNLVWQYQHQFPTWVDLSNVKRTHKNIELPPIPFLRQQIMMLSRAGGLVWIARAGPPALPPRQQAVPIFGRDLSAVPRNRDGAESEGLLPCADLSHAVRGGPSALGKDRRRPERTWNRSYRFRYGLGFAQIFCAASNCVAAPSFPRWLVLPPARPTPPWDAQFASRIASLS